MERAGGEADLCPVGDGGEGTLDALREPLGLELREAEVSDPLGRPVRARYGLGDRVAVVEVAAASGLGLVAPGERDAVAASSAGTGELIAAAVAGRRPGGARVRRRAARPPTGARGRSARSSAPVVWARRA